MDGRPPKRQRRSVQEKDSTEQTSTRSSGLSKQPVALSSRPKHQRPRVSRASSTRVPSSSPSPEKAGSSPKTTKSKSLHSFFQPATEGQRWSSQKFETKRSLATVSETTLDADVIEDDYDSYDEIFTQHLAGVKAEPVVGTNAQNGPCRARRPASKQTASSRPKKQPTKRFLMPSESDGSARQSSPAHFPTDVDRRPWAQRFAPSNLDELAVHKRKVSDVQNWLEDVFAGRRREVSVLFHQMGFPDAGTGEDTTWTFPDGGRDYWFYEAPQAVERPQRFHYSPNQLGLMSWNGGIPRSPNLPPRTTSP